MAGLMPTQIADYVTATLPVFEYNRYQSIAERYQRYEFISRAINTAGDEPGHPGVKKISSEGGQYLDWKVKVRNTGSFGLTGLFAPTTGAIVDHLISARSDWAFARTCWMYDDRENAFQGGRATILKEVPVRDDSAQADMAEGMEDAMWTAGVYGASPASFNGIPSFLVKSSTAAAGFNGGAPSGWTNGIDLISPTTYPQYKNGTATFLSINDGDLLPSLEILNRITYFQSPISYASIVDGMPQYVNYTCQSNIVAYSSYLTAANDNMESDAGRYRGSKLFGGNPWVWVPKLDADTDKPLYGVDWSACEFVFLDDWDIKRQSPIPVGSHQEHAWVVPTEIIGQFRYKDRRRGYVVYHA